MERITKTQHILMKQIITIFSNKKNVLKKTVRPVSSAPV